MSDQSTATDDNPLRDNEGRSIEDIKEWEQASREFDDPTMINAAPRGEQEWTAGHDGTGTWGIYHGNETRKGWSGKGRLLVSGLSESQAKGTTDAHKAALAAAVREAILNDVGQEGSEYILRLEQQLAAERTSAEAWRLTCKGKEGAYVNMESELKESRQAGQLVSRQLADATLEIATLKSALATEQEK